MNIYPKNSRSLRVRLIQLVLLALLPALALIIYGAREQRHDAIVFAENEALRTARILSATHQRLIDSTGHLLIALARIPEIRSGERVKCISLLSELIEEHPAYSNLAVADMKGDVFCQTVSTGKYVNIADRGYFKRAIQKKGLSVGEYQIGRATGKTSINLGYPIIGNNGNISGVVFAAINLDWFSQMVSAAELPESSILTLYDRRGTVLARHPESGQWVGRAVLESEIFRIVSTKSEGTTEAVGLDDKRRLYGFTSFGALPGNRDIYLTVGIPTEVALHAADSTLIRNLAALFVVSALALLAAWYAGNALILHPLGVLLNATTRIAAGNLTTRTGLPPGNDEVSRLASSFDKMAETLEMKKAEADRANLRTQKSLERIKALHDIDVAITSTLDLGAILQVLMEKIDLVLPQAVTTIRLFDKETGELAPVACRNIDENLWRAGHSRKLRGLTKKVLETRLPVPIANIQKLASTEIQNRLAHFGLVSYLGVPLIAKDEILGIIAFYTKDEHEFENEEKDFLVTLSGQVAIAIHNARLYEETKHSASEIAALHTLTLAATQSLDLDLILQEAIRKITQIFNFDAVRVLLFDRSMENLELRAAYESQPKFRAKVVSFKRGQGLVGKVTESGESLVIEDVLTDPSYTEISHSRNSIKAGARFTAFFPIQTKAKRWGAMVCVGKTPRKLKTNEISLLESMSNQIAIAVENSSLYQQTAAKAAELEKANKAKDEFLGVMSHELRTPLNVIKGYAEITRDDTFGQLNSEQKHALEKIYVHANELSHMIDSILQITAIEADTITIEPSEVNPCDILDELRSDYRIRASKELCIEWEYPARLPVFMSDDEKLKAILQNLLNNALKFTDNGTIKTSARHIPERQVIEFSVSDTGSGIAPDKLPSIFDMFKQADSSATRKHQGVGLGLYIVKKFVHLLGGQISVDSKFGEGSTFVVSFPSNMASRDPIGLAFQNSRRADA